MKQVISLLSIITLLGGQLLPLLPASGAANPLIPEAQAAESLSPAAQAGTIYYVDTDATGANDGTSWVDAYPDLQAALAMATAGAEIWVAAGVYTPTLQTDPGDPYSATFSLPPGVGLYGGFVGGANGETSRDERDWQHNLTILSGDIGTFGDDSDNAYHVVTADGTTTPITGTTVLDGFTVTAGRAYGSSHPHYHGGGFYCDGSGSICSPTLTNVTFSGNSASHDGGAMFNNGNQGTSNPTLTNVTFSGNSANYGGAMYNSGSEGTSNPTLTNVTFSGNSAYSGGAMFNYGFYGTGSPTLTNVTFSGNSAYSGGAMYNYGFYSGTSSPTLTNVIVWGNSGGAMFNEARHWGKANPLISYSLVQDGCPADASCDANLLTANPLFRDADGADDTSGTLDDNLRLQAASPAINAGDNSVVTVDTDLAGNPRIQDGRVDMGAYEFELVCPGGDTIFVDQSATGDNDGSNWPNAYTELQAGLNCGLSEIWVAAGTYTPTLQTDPADPRSATFSLPHGVALYGGFAGTETSRDERDWQHNLTILSGDIGTFGDDSDNAYHVVTAEGTTTPIAGSTVLDGFTITAGRANGSDPNGGGFYCDGSGSGSICSPTLTNVTFSGNLANYSGGAMYNSGSSGGTSSPTLINVTFSGNSASSGGAMYNQGDYGTSSPTLTNITFSGNSANYSGGAMYNSGSSGGTSSPTLINVTFSGNSADSRGGAMYNSGFFDGTSSPTLTNVTFSGNLANYLGGAMYNQGDYGGTSSPTLTNVILWGNSAYSGGAMYNQGDANPLISYSLVQDGCPAGASCDANLLTADPLFVSPPGDLRLQAASPAINAGDNSAVTVDTDLAGKPRIQHGTVDMGAYEFSCSGYDALDNLFVDQNATGANDGRSWPNAFTDLQTGLTIARYCGISEIWVAAGTYNPTLQTDPADPRSATFQLVSGVALYGGFAATETLRNQRDWQNNVTTLSGDIGQAGYRGDNSYHVVTGSGTDASARLDGFTITSGHANGSDPHNQGGGIFNQIGSPTLTAVQLISNTASLRGGGMANVDSSTTLTTVQLISNTASLRGGGMYNEGSHPTLTNVTFQDNSARYGGGIYNSWSGPALTNAVFQNNSAVSGAGIYNNWNCAPTLVNVTFYGNTAGGVHNFDSQPTIHNSILWGNTGGQITGDETSTISYSDIQGGWPGTGNIDADPLFVDKANGDLHLQPESPAIDAGDNDVVPPAVTTDLDGNPRIINGKVDMGAFESTYEFPPSLVKEVDQATTQPGTRITYTIVAENLKSVEPLTDVLIVDDLPAGLTFAGPIMLDPSGAGTIGTPPELVSDLTLVPGERITVTFPVTVNADIPAPAIIVNTASLSSPHTLTPTVSSVSVYVSAPAPPACSARPESSQIVYSSQDASALQQAVTNAPAGDTVKVAGTCRGVQALGAGTQTLYITKSLTIRGGYSFGDWDSANPPATPTILDAQNRGRVVYVESGLTVTLQDLNLVNGFDSAAGGGVYNAGSNLTLDHSTVSASLTNGRGGGIYHQAGTLALDSSTVYANVAAELGGGIYSQAPATVVNSTFSSNMGQMGGGGVYNNGASLTLRNSTFNQNQATLSGSGLYNSGGTVTVEDTILANDLAGNNCGGDPLSSAGYNLASDASCNLTATTDLTTTDPLLGPLGNYGGATPTHALLEGSPAIDAGNCSGGAVTNDQRGVSRPQRAACDIGAYEALPPPPPAPCMARVEGSHQTFGSDDAQAVREAVAAADLGGIIKVAGVCAGATGGDDEHDGNVVVLDRSLTLQGGYNPNFTVYDPATYPTTLDAVGNGRVVEVTSGVKVVLEDLIITNGNVAGGTDRTGADGGGIRNRADLTLKRVQVGNNTAHDALIPLFVYGYGGGIFNDGAPLLLIDSTVAGNKADSSGGGIHNTNGGVVTLQDSTIESNEASDFGGGLNLTKLSMAWVISSTIRNNTIDATVASAGGGISNFSGMLILQDSAVLSNTVETIAAAYGGGVNSNLGITTIQNSTVSGNTVRSTTVSAAGGGVNTAGGGLAILSSQIKDNRVTANFMSSGGGVNSTGMGSVTIDDSLISGNISGGGGGLDNDMNSTVEINSTTFANNQATARLLTAHGGAINNRSGGQISISNSTFSSNSASGIVGYGGAIYQEGGENVVTSITILNSTIFSNTALSAGGGVYNYLASVIPGVTSIKFDNTILANNHSEGVDGNCFNQFGDLISRGHNLADDDTCGTTPTGDIISPEVGVAPLVDTGGVLVHPLRYDSPAVDNGDCSGGTITEDQLGVTRPVGAGCDIGAVERSNTPAIPLDDAYAVELNGSLTVDAPGVLANDVDLQADPLTATLVDNSTNGALTLNPDGSFDYTPAPDFNGLDTFTYVADDPEASGVLTATVLIRVGPFIVTTSDDELDLPLDVNGDCSLREAVTAANTNVAVDRCGPGLPGQDTVILPAGGYALSLAGANEDGNASGDLDILEDLIINGAGQTTTVIDGLLLDRVFHIPEAGLAVQLNDLTVTNGSSNSDGGAIYNSGTLTVTHSTVSNSAAIGNGGGMFNHLSNLTLTEVTFSGNSADDGGGVFNEGGSPVLMGVTFDGNSAAYNGGGIYNGSGNPTLTGTLFISNTATNNGGGMYNAGGDPVLTSTTFDGNAATNNGGGLYNLNSSSTLAGVTFSDNTAIEGDGGGMVNYAFFGYSPVQTILSAIFSGNSAGDRGGGMANTQSSPTLTDVTFDGNTAGNGGGMSNNNYSKPYLANVTFSDNFAGGYGGGILNQDSNPVLLNVNISGNSTTSPIGGGGGMHNSHSSPTLINVVINGNSAGDGSGGGMNNSASHPTLTNVIFSGNTGHEGGGMNNHAASNPVLTNVTFSGNVASWQGGGVYNYESSPILQNSILWGNSAEYAGNQIHNINSTPTISDSIAQDGCPSGAACDHVIDADPLFVWNPDPGDGLWSTPVDNDYGNLHLRLGSPAIDAGDNAALPPDVTTDLDGNPRIVNGTVDMGAYEAGLLLIKAVDDPTPQPGDQIIFTIVAENAYSATQITGGIISDTLPSGLTFSGPIALDPPGAGVVGTAPPILVSDLTIAPGQRVTVTLPVLVDEDVPYGILINAASLTTTEMPGPIYGRVAVYVSAGVIYVDDTAAGLNDGSSWTNAYINLQDALAAAVEEDQVWVAAGIYTPTHLTDPGDPRSGTFQLRNGVALYGGFPDGGGAFEDRDWVANPTVLSGDIDGNDISDPDGLITSTADIVGENAYHVVTGSGTDASARLDGFTITGGKTRQPYSHYEGGGMYNHGGSPTLVNLRFLANSAHSGGGMMNIVDSSPTLINVAFHGNTADYSGGGMCNQTRSSPSLINVTFSGNSAESGGGGMMSYGGSSPSLINVTFSGNSAVERGGGMFNYGSPTIQNSILWGNLAAQDNQIYVWASAWITYSLVEGDCPPYGECSNLLTVDPQFVDADGPDGIPGTPDDNLRLQASSPAIDAGDNAALPADTHDLDNDGDTSEPIPVDLVGNERLYGDQVDLGAFEAQAQELGAALTAAPISGTVPLTVTFTDQSTGVPRPNSWVWTFGDGADSTEQHPTHTYTQTGVYTVTLTVSNPTGSDTLTKTNYITVTEPLPVAAFTASPVSGTAPLTVTFTDQSTGNPTSWAWAFGDGGSSMAQHPVYTYTLPGIYTVTLTVSNTLGIDTLTRTNYIAATAAPPVAYFSASPLVGTVPLTVTFTDLSTGWPTSWAWDFGDDGSSTEQHPSHTYVETGTFTVTLTVSNTVGSDTMVDENCVTVSEAGQDIYLPLIFKNQR
jgi:uncharacterized repeat protein (TIGR01451 family)/CSLREA domain-containing protein